LTAEVLLCHALGKERTYLYGHGEEELDEASLIDYERYLHQRKNGTPTQFITETQEFYGRPFRVTPAVLIPRPETEHVIEVAMERARVASTAIDIGCGSGAIGITWALESGSRVFASDISADAVAVARENATRLGARIEFAVCDLDSAFARRSFDLVLSNPPYIPHCERSTLQREIREHEPAVALFGGPTGTEIYERLIAGAARILKPGGWLIVEIGYQGESRVRAMLEEGWSRVETRHDLAGWPRVVSARYPE
jgi:release factor glutamine methyltransferase